MTTLHSVLLNRRPHRFLLVFIALALLFPIYAHSGMNIVVINTDDQRFDTLWSMPALNRLANEGVKFTNSFVSTPVCGPSRASILSGGYYAKNTGVKTMFPPNGSAAEFNNSNSLAVELKNAGYKTSMLGKYINGYNSASVPPGWDDFWSISTLETDLLVARAEAFLDENRDTPFFLYVAPFSPHHPMTPAAQDQDKFPGYVYRGRGYGEMDLSDKPSWVGTIASDHSIQVSSQAEQDEQNRDVLRSLQGVDRAIDSILNKLQEIGQLDNTVIFYSSDNGMLWGEHGLWRKFQPYEESIRVPFVVRMPGILPRIETAPVVANLDIGTTIFELANINKTTDGSSLVGLLNGISDGWRTEFLIEHYGQFGYANSRRTWAGIRARIGEEDWKYFEYSNGDRGMYNLTADPYELSSLHDDPQWSVVQSLLTAKLYPQRGLVVTTTLNRKDATQGQPFSYQFEAWGGDGNYSWSMWSGELPSGLVLDENTGLISGAPMLSGEYCIEVKVEDTALESYAERPQRFIQDFCIDVVAVTGTDADGDGLNEFLESALGTDINDADTDNDGLCDGPIAVSGICVAGEDLNANGVVDADEVDPTLADTDDDGLNDDVDPEPLTPNITPGDVAPSADPDGSINAADYMIMTRIVLGEITPTARQLLNGDLYPPGSPDGVINLQDLILLQSMVMQ